tara:strand:+ start:362 stop:571 length:210 start_codon:yes stop_codon:yes gene_type:complete
MSEIADLQDRYLSFFGEHPPIFGYPEEELLDALKNALETETPMRGYDEILNEQLGIDEKDVKAGKGARI